jgi:hypothetical protein
MLTLRSDSPELKALELHYARHVTDRLTYHEALARFTALWVYARRVNPDFPTSWESDIAADIELARVLNGLARPS